MGTPPDEVRAHRSLDETEPYFFAHETLPGFVLEGLGSAQVSTYLKRIRRWTDRTARQSWPPNTSTYLLHIYPQRLAESGARKRLTRLAMDTDRQHRLWEDTGNPLASIKETQAALQLHARGSGNLRKCLQLAAMLDLHRTSGAASTTKHVLAACALNELNRAESHASRLLGDAACADAIAALIKIVKTSHHLGDSGRVARNLDTAHKLLQNQRFDFPKDEHLQLLAAAGELGCGELARNLLTEILDFGDSGATVTAEWLTQLGTILAPLGASGPLLSTTDRLLDAARTEDDPYSRAQHLTQVAAIYAVAGERRRTRGLMRKAERLLKRHPGESSESPAEPYYIWLELADVAHLNDEHERAVRMLDAAKSVYSERLAWAVPALLPLMGAAGRPGELARVRQLLPRPPVVMGKLEEIVAPDVCRYAAIRGMPERVREWTDKARDPDLKAVALSAAAVACRDEEPEQAAEWAAAAQLALDVGPDEFWNYHTILSPEQNAQNTRNRRAETYARLACDTARMGDPASARRLLRLAERPDRTPARLGYAVSRLAIAAAGADDLATALSLVAKIRDARQGPAGVFRDVGAPRTCWQRSSGVPLRPAWMPTSRRRCLTS